MIRDKRLIVQKCILRGPRPISDCYFDPNDGTIRFSLKRAFERLLISIRQV